MGMDFRRNSMLSHRDMGIRADENGAYISIAWQEHLTNTGELFSCSDYIASSDDSHYWRFGIKLGVSMHLIQRIACDQPAIIEIFSNSSLISPGISLPITNININYQDKIVPTTQICRDCEVENEGSLIETIYTGISGVYVSHFERVLDNGQNHLIKVSPNKKGKKISVLFWFYEYKKDTD